MAGGRSRTLNRKQIAAMLEYLDHTEPIDWFDEELLDDLRPDGWPPAEPPAYGKSSEDE